MIAATYVTAADADAAMCDVRRLDDMMHHLIVAAFSLMTFPDVPTACERMVDMIVDEIDDDDPDALACVDIVHDPRHDLNADAVLMFRVTNNGMHYADMIMRRI